MSNASRSQHVSRWLLLGVVFLSVIGGITLIFSLQQESVIADPDTMNTDVEAIRGEAVNLSRRYTKLSARLRQLNQGDYIVVDTARNELLFISNSHVVLKAPCSTGSGRELTDPLDGRKWVFDTPRGEFRIASKIRNPVWRRPDWAFVETGVRPPANPEERLENGVLGDYALGFGNGYFLHGTLYTRLIGKNVTHGCIRLPDKALETLFNKTRLGTPLLIF
jgi:cell division protein FtsB